MSEPATLPGVRITVEPEGPMNERLKRAYTETLMAEIQRHLTDPDVQRRMNEAWFAHVQQSKDSAPDLRAALKATRWETTLLDVWLAGQSSNHQLTSDQECWLRDRIQKLRDAHAPIADVEDMKEPS